MPKHIDKVLGKSRIVKLQDPATDARAALGRKHTSIKNQRARVIRTASRATSRRTSTDRLQSRPSKTPQTRANIDKAIKGANTRNTLARQSRNVNPSGKTNTATRITGSSRIKTDRPSNIRKIITRLSKSMGKRSVLGGPIMQMAKDAASGKTMRRLKRKN